MGLHADVERRTVGEVVIIHQIERQRILVSAVVVQPEIGLLVEMVEVGHEGQVRAHLVLLRLVIDRRSHGHSDLEIAVGVAVADMRPVEGHPRALRLPVPVAEHRLAHGVGVPVVEHASEAALLHEFPAPADLRAVVGRIEPLVGHVELRRPGQVAESVVVVVHLPHVRIARAVQQDDARELLVPRHRKGRRYVGLGAQLVVEIEVHEEPLRVGGLAVFEVDLPGDGLVPRRHRRHALRHLDRIEPHAGRIAQPVGGAQAPHDRTVLVENLRVGPRQSEHLDLPGAGDGVAVTHGHRGRVLERLRQIAAGHLAKAREGDHLPLDDAVALDEVAAQVALDDDALQLDALGPEREVGPLHRLVDPERVVHVTQIRGHQTVVALHAVEQEGPFGIGRGADGRAGPIDRRPGQRPVVRIADHAPYVLRPERAARSDEKCA